MTLAGSFISFVISSRYVIVLLHSVKFFFDTIDQALSISPIALTNNDLSLSKFNEGPTRRIITMAINEPIHHKWNFEDHKLFVQINLFHDTSSSISSQALFHSTTISFSPRIVRIS